MNLQVFINNQNCTVNASYTIYMNQLMNITVIPLTSPEMIFIPNASVSLSDSNGLQLVFNSTSSAYYVELNSTALNVGTHFMSFIFSDQNYQSMAITMQITVQQIKLHAQINHMNSTLTQDTSTQYSVMINVEDSATNLPIINANVSYSWAFGTGFLSNLGNGSYSFNSTIPSQPGTYFIQITIVPNINYEIQTIQFIIVATTPSTSSNAWIMVDGLGILIVLVLIGVVIKQNIINPKRTRILADLKNRTQVIDDIQNIRAIMVIQKRSGLLIFNQIVSGKEKMEELLFSGFIQAIALFSAGLTNPDTNQGNYAENDKPSAPKYESLEFIHNNFNILVIDGSSIRAAAILDYPASDTIKAAMQKFIARFEDTFDFLLANWDGNTDLFAQTTQKIVEEIFNLALLKNYTLNSEINNDALKNYVRPNTIAATVYTTILTLVKEQGFFKLSTIISLISEANRLEAKKNPFGFDSSENHYFGGRTKRK